MEPEDVIELNASDSANGLSLIVSFCGRGGMPPYSAGDRVAVLYHGSVTLGSVLEVSVIFKTRFLNVELDGGVGSVILAEDTVLAPAGISSPLLCGDISAPVSQAVAAPLTTTIDASGVESSFTSSVAGMLEAASADSRDKRKSDKRSWDAGSESKEEDHSERMQLGVKTETAVSTVEANLSFHEISWPAARRPSYPRPRPPWRWHAFLMGAALSSCLPAVGMAVVV